MTNARRPTGAKPARRIGVVGAGSIAGAHAVGYDTHAARITVAAVVDTDLAAAAEFAERFSAPHFPSLAKMLDSVELDGVDICLPHSLHAEAVLGSLTARLPVLVEKPLCITASEAAAIERAAATANVPMMAGHNQLHIPTVAAARAAIVDGAIGRVVSIQVQDCFRAGFTADSIGWRGDPAMAGGGVLIDTGYHPTYLVRHLAGVEPVDAFARLARHRLDFLPTEDTATVLYRFPDGVTGRVETSWAYDLPSRERFIVHGTDGTISATDCRLTVARVDSEPDVRQFAAVNTVAAEIAAFADCLDGAPPPNDVRDAASVLRMILAAYESAESDSVRPVRTG